MQVTLVGLGLLKDKELVDGMAVSNQSSEGPLS